MVDDIEDCARNPLDDEDMKPGGRVDQYLAQIKPRLMAEINWDIIKNDYHFTNRGGNLLYDSTKYTGVKFVNPELDPSVPDTNPFDRDIDAFGLYTAENGRKYDFVVVVIRDTDAPTETGHDIYFIKTLLSHQHTDGTPLSQFEIDYMRDIWKNKMNIAPIGLNSNPMREPGGFKDPTFAHLEEGSPEFEIWFPAYLELVRGGPLSNFKTLENYLFPTSAHNVVNLDGTPNNTYR